MSTPLIQFAFNVDMSGSVVTASAVAYASASLPATYMKIDISKNSFMTGTGFAYTVTTTNGAVTSVTATAVNNINAANIATAASGTFAWLGTTNQTTNRNIDTTFNYANQGVWSQKINFDAISTVTSLGRHLTYLANSILNGKQLTNELGGPLGNTLTTISTTAATINTNIGTAIRNALGTQANLQIILDALIKSSGAFYPSTTGSYTQVYDSTLSPISLLLTMTSLTLKVTYYGVQRDLVIQSLPLLVNIA